MRFCITQTVVIRNKSASMIMWIGNFSALSLLPLWRPHVSHISPIFVNSYRQVTAHQHNDDCFCRNSCSMFGILTHRPMSRLLSFSESYVSASCWRMVTNFAGRSLADMKFETDMLTLRSRLQTVSLLLIWAGNVEPQRATDSGDGNDTKMHTRSSAQCTNAHSLSEFSLLFFTYFCLLTETGCSTGTSGWMF